MLSKKLEEFVQEFVPPILQACKAQFPRTCKCCGRQFVDFADYVRGTRPIGLIADLEVDDDPLGLMSMANCGCGTTMALRCENPEMHAMFVKVLRKESSASGRSLSDILTELRSRIRATVLAETNPTAMGS